jgi:hypothetical protein
MSQKINVQIVELFWARDLNDARHAAIRVTHVDGWTALFYEHPSDGWQIVELELESASESHGNNGRVCLDSLTDPAAATEFERIAGTLVSDEPLDNLADDLYELGQRGANRRWKNRPVALEVSRG